MITRPPLGTASLPSSNPWRRVELRPINVRDAREIDQAVAAFASSANGSLVVTASPQATDHRDLIITLAAKYKLPAIYFERLFAAAGGLISYLSLIHI